MTGYVCACALRRPGGVRRYVRQEMHGVLITTPPRPAGVPWWDSGWWAVAFVLVALVGYAGLLATVDHFWGPAASLCR